MTKLSIDIIRQDGGTQPRAIIQNEWISDYANDMQTGAKFPPIVVFFDGNEYWLADGFHRVGAAAVSGQTEIDADVRQGTRRDAVLFSVGANGQHGHRRTNEDKRRSVDVLLNDAKWSKWSDSEIARRCGVSQQFVSSRRASRAASYNESRIDTRLVTRNGVTYEMQTYGMGQRPVAGTGNDADVLEGDASADDEDADTDEPKEGDGFLHACDRCYEHFCQPVWHCDQCQSHWGPYHDRCGNCETPRPGRYGQYDFDVNAWLSDEGQADDEAGESEDSAEDVTENSDSAAHNHRAQGTGENEWYTPTHYIEAAREVMGGIDLDPASSEIANETVQARRFFTIDDDGLKQRWKGNVWLNPPYAQPWIAMFMEKLTEEVEKGNVKQAIALTHNYTDTKWFRSAGVMADRVCLTAGRIAFLDSNGKKAAPTQGQAFFYFGPNRNQFVETFSKFGWFPNTKDVG